MKSETLYKKSPISDRRSLPFLTIIGIRISIIRIITMTILLMVTLMVRMMM